jgi:hypothetical protein
MNSPAFKQLQVKLWGNRYCNIRNSACPQVVLLRKVPIFVVPSRNILPETGCPDASLAGQHWRQLFFFACDFIREKCCRTPEDTIAIRPDHYAVGKGHRGLSNQSITGIESHFRPATRSKNHTLIDF